MPELSVSRLMQKLHEAPEEDPSEIWIGDQAVRKAVSDGAYALWINVLKPLLSGETVTTGDLDFSAFSYEDLEEIGLWYSQHLEKATAWFHITNALRLRLSEAIPVRRPVPYL